MNPEENWPGEKMASGPAGGGLFKAPDPTVVIGDSRRAKIAKLVPGSGNGGYWVVFEDETPKREMSKEFIEGNNVEVGGFIIIGADESEKYEAPVQDQE